MAAVDVEHQGRHEATPEEAVGDEAPPGITVAGSWDEFVDPRDALIEETVPGRSFVDVGGLFGEKVSRAARAGARELALIDVVDEPALWGAFALKAGHLGMGVEIIQADVNTVERSFEVVHASGVLYHQPDPLAHLRHLRSMTKVCCILTSMVLPRRIENERGEIQLPVGAAVFVPALSSSERAVIDCWLRSVGLETGMPEWHEAGLEANYWPNWWLPTEAATSGLATAAGFTVERRYRWGVFPALTLLLNPIVAEAG